MKRENLLLILVVILLLLNIGSVTFFFLGVPRHAHGPMHRPGRPEEILAKLQWSEKQQQEFEVFRERHFSRMQDLHRQSEVLTLRYFELLQTASADTGQANKLEAEIGAVYAAKAQNTFGHFNDIRNLCTPEQQKEFDKILPELIQILVRSGPAPPYRPR